MAIDRLTVGIVDAGGLACGLRDDGMDLLAAAAGAAAERILSVLRSHVGSVSSVDCAATEDGRPPQLDPPLLFSLCIPARVG